MRDGALRDAAFALAPTQPLAGVGRLTPASIAECQAVLNQHWLYAYRAEWSRRYANAASHAGWWALLVASWEGKELTFYGDAFEAFAKVNPTADLNASAPLATLGVVCALALDGEFPAECERRVQWSQAYPPSRFLNLANAVARVGLLPADSVALMDAASYRSYAARLCDEAGLRTPEKRSDHSSCLHWPDSPANDLRRLFRDAGLAADRLAEAVPAAVVATAEASVYQEEELMRPDCGLAFQAPLLVVGGFAASSVLDEHRFELCAVAGIYQRAMLALMVETGPLAASGRPRCERGGELFQSTVDLIRGRLDISVDLAGAEDEAGSA